MSNIVLSVKNLTKMFGERCALNNATFDIKEGEIVGFIGPNGSGKTTCIKSIFGLIVPNSGEVSISGYSINENRQKALEKANGIVENPEFYKYLTGKQNLKIFANMYPFDISDEKLDELLDLVELGNRKNDKVGKYSLGMKQRLGLAQALINDPSLLILDEPTNGLDPEGIRSLRNIIVNVAKTKNVSVFISSHQLLELDTICDRFIIISKGNILANLSKEEIHSLGKNKAMFSIKTNEESVPNAKVLFDSNNIEYVCEESKFEITLNDNQDKQQIIKMIVNNNIYVSEIYDIKTSLEDSFINILNGTTEEGDVKNA